MQLASFLHSSFQRIPQQPSAPARLHSSRFKDSLYCQTASDTNSDRTPWHSKAAATVGMSSSRRCSERGGFAVDNLTDALPCPHIATHHSRSCASSLRVVPRCCPSLSHFSINSVDDDGNRDGVACHCRTCQKLHTSASYNAKSEVSKVHVTKGSPVTYDDTKADSGKRVECARASLVQTTHCSCFCHYR